MLNRTCLALLVAVAALATACSSGSNPCPSGMCAGETGADAGTEAAADAARDATDAVSDAAMDVPVDESIDAGGDTMPPIDAAPDVAPDVTSDVAQDGACGACLTDDVSWGYSGGFVAFHDTFGASPCNTFSHMHVAGGTTTMCTDEIPCTGTISTSDIERAIADPDVQAALMMAPITYGRPFPDAPSYEITVNGHTITILGSCGGLAGCTDPPAGVQNLRNLLDMLAVQQNSMPACTAVFGGG